MEEDPYDVSHLFDYEMPTVVCASAIGVQSILVYDQPNAVWKYPEAFIRATTSAE